MYNRFYLSRKNIQYKQSHLFTYQLPRPQWMSVKRNEEGERPEQNAV